MGCVGARQDCKSEDPHSRTGQARGFGVFPDRRAHARVADARAARTISVDADYYRRVADGRLDPVCNLADVVTRAVDLVLAHLGRDAVEQPQELVAARANLLRELRHIARARNEVGHRRLLVRLLVVHGHRRHEERKLVDAELAEQEWLGRARKVLADGEGVAPRLHRRQHLDRALQRRGRGCEDLGVGGLQLGQAGHGGQRAQRGA